MASTSTSDIEHTARKIRDLAKKDRTLTFYWNLGRAVRELGDDRYGKQLVKKLADALEVDGLNEATLRKACRFADVIKDGELDVSRLERLEISWRSASRLTAKQLTKSDRDRLLDRVEAGEVEAAKLGAEIRKKLANTHGDSHRAIDAAQERAMKAIKTLQDAVKRSSSDRAEMALVAIKELLAGK